MSKAAQFAKRWLLPPGVVDFTNDKRSQLQFYFGHSAGERNLLRQSAVLKDRHIGQRCFVLGAGSSVSSQDLQKLKGEFVISVSNTFVHPDIAMIRPKYHVTPSIIGGHGSLYESEKFVKWLREMEAATHDSEMIFYIGDKPLIEANGLFRGRPIHWVRYASYSGYMDGPIDLARLPPVWSVSETAITLAVYMGFKNIYLLGIDHDWFNGPLIYFYNHKTQHVLKPDQEKLGWADAEFQMRRHADIFKRYKYLFGIKHNIFNANSNPKHYLDIFPKVDFDSLFKADGEQVC